MNEEITMYTFDETGVMNNYAVEPQMYFAAYPTDKQQRRYLQQGAVAALLIALTVLTTFVIS
jgi:hypothetical protein